MRSEAGLAQGPHLASWLVGSRKHHDLQFTLTDFLEDNVYTTRVHDRERSNYFRAEVVEITVVL